MLEKTKKHGTAVNIPKQYRGVYRSTKIMQAKTVTPMWRHSFCAVQHHFYIQTNATNSPACFLAIRNQWHILSSKWCCGRLAHVRAPFSLIFTYQSSAEMSLAWVVLKYNVKNTAEAVFLTCYFFPFLVAFFVAGFFTSFFASFPFAILYGPLHTRAPAHQQLTFSGVHAVDSTHNTLELVEVYGARHI